MNHHIVNACIAICTALAYHVILRSTPCLDSLFALLSYHADVDPMLVFVFNFHVCTQSNHYQG